MQTMTMGGPASEALLTATVAPEPSSRAAGMAAAAGIGKDWGKDGGGVAVPAAPRLVVFERTPRFDFQDFADLQARPGTWLVKHALPRRGVAFVAGASKGGKTFVILDGLLRLSSGQGEVWGRKAHGCAGIYVAAEDPDGCELRIAGWRQANPEARAVPFRLLKSRVDLLDETLMADFKAALHEQAADFAAQGRRLGYIAFDTLSKCIPGAEENSSGDMSRVLDVLEDIAAALDLLVIVVAHFGKAGEEKGIRGWSGLGANADAVLVVSRDPEAPDSRSLSFQKVKNGPDGEALDFHLRRVALDVIDEDGEAVTTCTPCFEPRDRAATGHPQPPALNDEQALVLRAIGAVTDNGETHPVPANVTSPRRHWKAVRFTDVREQALATGFPARDKLNSTERAFSRAVARLCRLERVRREGDYLWIV